MNVTGEPMASWSGQAGIRLLIQLNAKADILMSGLSNLTTANTAQAAAITAQLTAQTAARKGGIP